MSSSLLGLFEKIQDEVTAMTNLRHSQSISTTHRETALKSHENELSGVLESARDVLMRLDRELVVNEAKYRRLSEYLRETTARRTLEEIAEAATNCDATTAESVHARPNRTSSTGWASPGVTTVVDPNEPSTVQDVPLPQPQRDYVAGSSAGYYQASDLDATEDPYRVIRKRHGKLIIESAIHKKAVDGSRKPNKHNTPKKDQSTTVVRELPRT